MAGIADGGELYARCRQGKIIKTHIY